MTIIISAGTHGYHLYTREVLPHIKDFNYNRLADLWEAEINKRLPFMWYILNHDIPAGILPDKPISCIVASSVRLVQKIPFEVTDKGIILLV